MTSGWIGVDLDGTLAVYHGWSNGEIGVPVPLMVERVKKWLSEGITVKIVTARAACEEMIEPIELWCEEHIGRRLQVTDKKDFAMIELWDDRAIQVEQNTGKAIQDMVAFTDKRLR